MYFACRRVPWSVYLSDIFVLSVGIPTREQLNRRRNIFNWLFKFCWMLPNSSGLPHGKQKTRSAWALVWRGKLEACSSRTIFWRSNPNHLKGSCQLWRERCTWMRTTREAFDSFWTMLLNWKIVEMGKCLRKKSNSYFSSYIIKDYLKKLC